MYNANKLTMLKQIGGIFLLVAMTFTLANAQKKYGHVNYGNLLTSLPEVSVANNSLQTYQEGLIAKGEAMAKEFQTEYGKFVSDVQSGILSPVQQQERQTALEKKQNEIISYEQLVAQQVQTKRAELMQPIMTKVEKAIAEIAKEGGYELIFDTSVFNAVLFAQETDDLLEAVKVKLGVG